MHNGINNVLEYHGESIFELRKKIKQNNYDLIFDIHKNLRSVFSTLFLRAEKKRYKKGTLKKLLLVSLKINFIKSEIPVYKRYLFALDKIRYLDNLDFSSSDLNFDKAKIIGEPYILVAPSSIHFTKTLPREKFEKIIKSIKNKKIVLVGSNSDSDKNICECLSGISDNIINKCGKTDYNILANLMCNSDLIICNDSGILHLAEALDKKVIAFFGSTVKEFGFYPQLKSTIVFENKNLKCRPCTHIGKNKCPKKHFRCMNDIDINEVIKIINENLS